MVAVDACSEKPVPCAHSRRACPAIAIGRIGDAVGVDRSAALRKKRRSPTPRPSLSPDQPRAMTCLPTTPPRPRLGPVPHGSHECHNAHRRQIDHNHPQRHRTQGKQRWYRIQAVLQESPEDHHREGRCLVFPIEAKWGQRPRRHEATGKKPPTAPTPRDQAQQPGQSQSRNGGHDPGDHPTRHGSCTQRTTCSSNGSSGCIADSGITLP